MRVGRALLLAAFFLVIGLPPLVAVFRVGDDVAEAEKRRLAPFPQMGTGWADRDPFPRAFEAWFDDHFGLRSLLIGGYRWLMVRALGVSTDDQVALGRDGWLFYGGQAMDAHRGVRSFTPGELFVWQRYLEGLRDWLAHRGTRFLFVVPPDKQSVYPEFVAPAFNRVGPTPLDQLVTHLAAHSDLEILDLRPVLARHKGEARLYMVTDSHWTPLGAYHGYRAVMGRLGAWFPGLKARPLDAFDVARRRVSGGNLAQFLGVGEAYSEENVTLTPRFSPCTERTPVRLPAPRPWTRGNAPFRTGCPQAGGLRAVVLRDSFADPLVPLLAQHFREAVFIWQGAANHPLADSFPLLKRLVADAPVDLVVSELVERKLVWPLRIHPELLEATARRRFGASPEVRLSRSGIALQGEVAAVQQVAVTPHPSGVRVRTQGSDPLVMLPALSPARGGWPVIRVRLHSPSATRGKVLFRTGSPEAPSPWRVLELPIRPGVNDWVVELPVPDLVEPLLLQPGAVPGDYVIHGVAARQWRPPARGTGN